MSYLTSPGFSFHNCKRAIISLVGVILRIKWDEECKSSHHTDVRLEVKRVKLSFLLLPSPGFLKGGTFTSAETSVHTKSGWGRGQPLKDTRRTQKLQLHRELLSF